MNLHEEQKRVQKAVANSLSHVREDPWLTQRILANVKGEKPVKQKASLVLAAVVFLLAMTTIAFAGTRLYRVINWQGEVTRTVDPTQTPASVNGQPADMDRLRQTLRLFMSEIPDAETACAWFEGDDGAIKCSEVHWTQKQFSSMEALSESVSGIQHLTVPASLPEGKIRIVTGRVFMECKASGHYSLIRSGQSGPMRYNRFLIDESSAVAAGYELILSMEDGTIFSIRSELMGSPYEEPISLREGETAQKVSVEGMDALLIAAQAPEYPDGLLLQRKLKDPVELKQLPLHDNPGESDVNQYQYEYITIWAYHLDDPEALLAFFSAE